MRDINSHQGWILNSIPFNKDADVDDLLDNITVIFPVKTVLDDRTFHLPILKHDQIAHLVVFNLIGINSIPTPSYKCCCQQLIY